MPYPRAVLATGRGAWLSVIVIIMLIPLSNIAPVIVKGGFTYPERGQWSGI
jgi:hypothetical protein